MSLDDFLLARMRAAPSAPLVVIELKAAQSAFAVGMTLTRFFNKGMLNKRDVIVSSFIYAEADNFKKLIPDVPVALCINGIPHDYSRAVAKLGADALFIDADYVERTMIDEARHYGAKVFVDGVNKPEHIARLMDMKVSGVVTKSPREINKLVNGLSGSTKIERTLRECA
jgi:glycerophosphoryl diester phosphodiesterase